MTTPKGLEQFLSGATDVFGGPSSVNDRRRVTDVMLAVGAGLLLAVFVGLGLLGTGIIKVGGSKGSGAAMSAPAPMIAGERPGSAKAPDASPNPSPIENAAAAPPPATAAPISAPAVRAQLAAWWTAAPHTAVPISETAARARLAAWWTAAHSATNPHPSPRQRRHSGAVPRFPELMQIYAPPPRDFGCPPSLGAGCSAPEKDPR